MLTTHQTPEQFQNYITEKVNEYETVKIDLGLDYASFQDDQGDMIYYIITNNHITTKLLYNKLSRCIVESHIYNSDIIVINQLKDKIYQDGENK